MGRQLLHILIAITILGAGYGVGSWIISGKKPPAKRPPSASTPFVEVSVLTVSDHTIEIASRGRVRPKTETSLIAQVEGVVQEISESLLAGGFFEKDETLLQLESSDYKTAAVIAEAELRQAEARLADQRARAEQAREDWNRLSKGREPSPLALRQPQLQEAVASAAAARERHSKALRDLKRTTIVAPYAGRIVRKLVDVGTFVRSGTVLAEIYAIDHLEIPLPVSEKQLTALNMPEVYRGNVVVGEQRTKVRLTTSGGLKKFSYEAYIDRVESVVDKENRMLSLIAQVDNPYAFNEEGRPPLKPGQFVQATIEGRKLSQIIRIPRRAVNNNEFVYRVEPGTPKVSPPLSKKSGQGRSGGGLARRAPGKNGILKRCAVEIQWADEQFVFVEPSDLKAGDLISLTNLPYAVDGMEVNYLDNETKQAASSDVSAFPEPRS